MDPDLVSKLSAEKDQQEGHLEFPSAEVDLKTFHDKVLKAKTLLNESTSVQRVCGYGIESSVDAEDYSKPILRELSAPPSLSSALPPPLGSSSSELGSGAGAGVGVAGYSAAPLNSGTRLLSGAEAGKHTYLKVNSSGTESSVDVSEKPEAVGSSEASITHAHNNASDFSLEEFGSASDSTRDSKRSVEDVGKKEGVSEGCGKGVEPDAEEVSAEAEEMEEKVEKLLEELSDKTPLTSTSMSIAISPSSVRAEGEGEGDGEGRVVDDGTGSNESLASLGISGGGAVRIVATSGMGSDDLADEVFLMPSLTTESPGGIPAITTGATSVDSTEVGSQEMEVKSVSTMKTGDKQHQQQDNARHSNTSSLEKGSPGKKASLSSQKITISSVDKPSNSSAEVAELDGVSESVTLLIKQLQIQLREKEEDVGRLQRQKERELRERDDKVKKLTREAKKVEREKWELLKRARDAAERSLHLRTQLDTKEGTLRSIQGELDRTRDELVSVKSANTSLRALLSDLRASRPSTEVGVQTDANVGSTLRRNRSIELAFNNGEMSQDQERDDGFDSTADVRMSSSSLGLHWPDRWEKDGMSSDSVSLQDLGHDPTYQPLGSRESRKSRKRGALLSKMIKSSGSKRGSKTSIASMGESCDQ
jgi:hypothetical protein